MNCRSLLHSRPTPKTELRFAMRKSCESKNPIALPQSRKICAPWGPSAKSAKTDCAFPETRSCTEQKSIPKATTASPWPFPLPHCAPRGTAPSTGPTLPESRSQGSFRCWKGWRKDSNQQSARSAFRLKHMASWAGLVCLIFISSPHQPAHGPDSQQRPDCHAGQRDLPSETLGNGGHSADHYGRQQESQGRLHGQRRTQVSFFCDLADDGRELRRVGNDGDSPNQRQQQQHHRVMKCRCGQHAAQGANAHGNDCDFGPLADSGCRAVIL